MKKLVRGCWNHQSGTLDWDKLSAGLLIFLNTPRHNGKSPAQTIFGHPIRDTIPAHRRAFAPEWQKQADELEVECAKAAENAEIYYNKSAHPLSPIKVQDRVAVQDSRTGRWDKYGVVVETGEHRDFWIKLASGRVLRRNRKFIRKRTPMSAFEVGHPTPKLGAPMVEAQARAPPGAPKQTRFGRVTRIPDRLQINPNKKSYT